MHLTQNREYKTYFQPWVTYENEDQQLEMALLQLLEIDLCIRPIPKVNELTEPTTPAPVSFAQSVEQRLGAVHSDGCWAACFFLDLEGKSGEKVPQSSSLWDTMQP